MPTTIITARNLEDLMETLNVLSRGGADQHGRQAVWSWDETRLLVGDGTRFRIIQRDGR